MWVQFVFFSPFVYPDISSSELFVPVHLSTLVLYISGIFYNVISFVAMQFTHFIVHTCILDRNKLERKKKKKKRCPQGEALPLHIGWADPCDYPKCG